MRMGQEGMQARQPQQQDILQDRTHGPGSTHGVPSNVKLTRWTGWPGGLEEGRKGPGSPLRTESLVLWLSEVSR